MIGLDWLKKLVNGAQSSGPPRTSGMVVQEPDPECAGKKVNLVSLVNYAGRINYVVLQNYAGKFGKEEFLAQMIHPVFMGKELAQGRFLSRRTSSAGQDKTCSFVEDKSAMAKAQPQPESIEAAVYVLLKDVGDLENFTIGRTSESDLTINDASVSKEHARLFIREQRYYLQDLNATNGTFVNGGALKNATRELKPWDEVTFGRLTFLFLSPENLYDRLLELA